MMRTLLVPAALGLALVAGAYLIAYRAPAAQERDAIAMQRAAMDSTAVAPAEIARLKATKAELEKRVALLDAVPGSAGEQTVVVDVDRVVWRKRLSELILRHQLRLRDEKRVSLKTRGQQRGAAPLEAWQIELDGRFLDVVAIVDAMAADPISFRVQSLSMTTHEDEPPRWVFVLC